jgi:SAM-dependent methyltransferase
VLSRDVSDFVLASLPPEPARVLEVGAGEGELARTLRARGYDVVAVDPNACTDDVLPIPIAELDEPPSSFDAAVAVVSLHHVVPLEGSCARLGELLRPDATLVVDEFDVELFDERAAGWWLEQRRALGVAEERSAGELVGERRAELHPLGRILAALEPFFELDPPRRCSYLYRWGLEESLRVPEEEQIATGRLPAVGARVIGRRVART